MQQEMPIQEVLDNDRYKLFRKNQLNNFITWRT